MQIGIVGLGRMGGNMARRWMRGGHTVVGHVRNAATLQAFAKEGLVPAATLQDLVSRLKPPRAVWLMLPAGGPTEEAVTSLGSLLAAGHFVKMIHNGIEYGMMQSYAEGFALLESKQEFGLDLKQVAAIWQDGSVVR